MTDRKSKAVVCGYCGNEAVLLSGREVYPHRSDLAGLNFWACKPCDARVGCHRGTKTPLGRLANAELRRLKQQAHAAFDPTWQNTPRTRREQYLRLSVAMGVKSFDCHIGLFNEDQCREVLRLCGDGSV